MRIRRPKRYRVAVHEAGHAVIGRVLNFPCGDATIVPNRAAGTLGSAHVDTSHEAWYRWMDIGKERDEFVLLRAGIIVSLAGREAERELLGGMSDGYDGDYENALARAMEMSDVALDPDQRAMKRLCRQTARLVRKHKDKIERVAASLIDCRTLSGAEVDALVAPVANTLPPAISARCARVIVMISAIQKRGA